VGRAALILLLSSCAVGIVAPRAVHAAPDAGARSRKRLAEGRKLYEEQEYRRAIRELAPIGRDPAATRSQRLEALELLGLCWFILGESVAAREAFEDLLAIDPDYQLREASGSPKIRSFFERVKKSYLPDYRPDARVALEHAAPASAMAGRKLELLVDVTSGQDVVKELTLHWRRRGVMAYSSTPLRNVNDNHWRARFTPPADTASYTLEYYIDARDLASRSVARIGGPETPLALPLTGAPSESPSWYQRWYIWVGATALVLAGTSVYLVTTSDSAPSGTLPPGTVDLGAQ
jgi:hypothetical protein